MKSLIVGDWMLANTALPVLAEKSCKPEQTACQGPPPATGCVRAAVAAKSTLGQPEKADFLGIFRRAPLNKHEKRSFRER